MSAVISVLQGRWGAGTGGAGSFGCWGRAFLRVPCDWWLGGYFHGSVCDLDKVAPAGSWLGILEAGVKWAPARGAGRGAWEHARFMWHFIGFL